MQNNSSWRKTILWVSLYSIGMAFLESAVVVYLRTIYFPHGFIFPLVALETHIAVTELIREFATIIMLLSIGFIAGENFVQRFAFFIYSFAIWDIFYYIFLKLILNWPESFFTWDVLFLIPVSWTSPVIAPVFVSITMIILAFVILILKEKNVLFRISWPAWLMFVAGSMVIILSFIWDYTGYMIRHFSMIQLFSLEDKAAIRKIALAYVPDRFNWLLFIAGELTILTGIMHILLKRKNTRKI